jgi:hypothetical protein
VNTVTLLTNPSLPANAFLAISLYGSGVELGTVSAGAVCRYAEALRLGLQGAVEIIESAKLVATPGRRKRWIERMTDLPLLGIEPRDLRILLGEPKQPGLFADSDRESLVKAVDLLFQGLAGFAADMSGADDGLSCGIPPDVSPKLLGIVARLMPPRRGPITHVAVWRQTDVSTGSLPIVITLDRSSRDRIAAEIDKRCIPYRSTNSRLTAVDPAHRPLVF